VSIENRRPKVPRRLQIKGPKGSAGEKFNLKGTGETRFNEAEKVTGGKAVIFLKIPKAFATEGTEATEGSGPKPKGQISTSGEAYLSFERCKGIYIRSIFISVLSVSSVAKQFPYFS